MGRVLTLFDLSDNTQRTVKAKKEENSGKVLSVINFGKSSFYGSRVQQRGKVLINSKGLYAGKGSKLCVQIKGGIVFEDTIKEVYSGLRSCVVFTSGLKISSEKIVDFNILV